MILRTVSFLLVLDLGLGLVNCGMVGAPRGEPLKTITISNPVSLAAFSSDGEILATVDRSKQPSGSYSINIWQTDDGRLKHSTDKYGVYDLTFSADGLLLAASCDDGVRLFRLTDGHLVRTLKGNQIFTSAFSPDGQTLAAGGAQGEVQVWRVNDGHLLHVYNASKWVTSIAFSPDGQVLAAGTASNIGFVRPSEGSLGNNPILLWQVGDHKSLNSLEGHQYGVSTLSFSQDGQTLASGGSDGFLRLWRLGNSALLKSVSMGDKFDQDTGSPFGIEQVVFNLNGRLLVVAASDKVFLLQSNDLSLISTFKGHTKVVLRVLFIKGETTLVSVSEDRTVRYWQVMQH